MDDAVTAYMELNQAERIATDNNTTNSFRGKLYHDNKHDVEWIRDVMNIYLGQYEVGLTCLLKNDIDRVQKVVNVLDKKLENM